MKRYLVTGATGKQGGAVARRLIDDGLRVRAMTRNPEGERARALEALGAEIYAGNLGDPDSVGQAVAGVDGVFSVQNYWDQATGFEGEIAQARNLALAAKQEEVRHFVQSTMAKADDVTSVPHFESKRRIESQLAEIGIPHTLIGTVFFMDNVLDPKMGGSMTFPTLSGSLRPTTRIHLLLSDDVAGAVAQVFSRPEKYVGRRVNLAGDQLTVTEMKSIYQEVIGRKPKGYRLPRLLLRFMAKEFSDQLDWYNSVNFGFSVADSKREFPHLTSFADFLRSHPIPKL